MEGAFTQNYLHYYKVNLVDNELYFLSLQLYGDTVQVWTRPIVPVGSFAVAIIYTKQSGYPIHVSVKLKDIGLISATGYNVTELFDGKQLGYYSQNSNFTTYVNPSGIYMVKVEITKPKYKIRNELRGNNLLQD